MKDFEMLDWFMADVRDIIENGSVGRQWFAKVREVFAKYGDDFNPPPSYVARSTPMYLLYVREVLNKQESPAWAPSLSAELAGRDVPRGDLEWALHQFAVREAPDGDCREQTYLELIATLKYEDICDGEKWMRVREALTRLHKAAEDGWHNGTIVTLLFQLREAVVQCFPREMGLVDTDLVLGVEDE